jgi:hypothetical protein
MAIGVTENRFVVNEMAISLIALKSQLGIG